MLWNVKWPCPLGSTPKNYLQKLSSPCPLHCSPSSPGCHHFMPRPPHTAPPLSSRLRPVSSTGQAPHCYHSSTNTYIWSLPSTRKRNTFKVFENQTSNKFSTPQKKPPLPQLPLPIQTIFQLSLLTIFHQMLFALKNISFQYSVSFCF